MQSFITTIGTIEHIGNTIETMCNLMCPIVSMWLIKALLKPQD